jgi:hypothetical protein
LLNFENLIGLKTMSLRVDSSKGLLTGSFGKAENSSFFLAVLVVGDLNPVLPLHSKVFLMGLLKLLFFDVSDISMNVHI